LAVLEIVVLNVKALVCFASGASSLEKRGLSWKGSFWYHFSP